MAGQKGSELLLRRGDGGSPETFTTVAGLRTKSLSLNSETVDITNSDTVSKWRQLLAGAGIKTLSASGDGVFTDSASEESVRADFFSGNHPNYQLVIPSFGNMTFPAQIASLEYAGEHNNEVTWSVGVESAGDVAFAAI